MLSSPVTFAYVCVHVLDTAGVERNLMVAAPSRPGIVAALEVLFGKIRIPNSVRSVWMRAPYTEGVATLPMEHEPCLSAEEMASFAWFDLQDFRY